MREDFLPASTVKDQTAALFLEGAAEGVDPKSGLHLAQTPQRELVASTHDDVVMERQAEILAALLDFLGHADVGFRGRWITRRVVVDQDQGTGVQHQRPLDHLARIDRDMINSAGREKLIGDDAVLTVEIEDVEAFDGATNGEGIMQTSA